MLLAAAPFDAALLWAILQLVGQARVYESAKPRGDLAPPPGAVPVVVPARVQDLGVAVARDGKVERPRGAGNLTPGTHAETLRNEGKLKGRLAR